MNMLEDDEYIMLNYGCRELEKFLVGREDWHYAGKARSIIRRYKQIIDKEERERAEKQAREEQEKRDAYWAEHSSEKAALEAELQEIESRITVLNEEIEYNTKVIEPKIAELVKKRKNELPEEKEFLKQKKLVLELEALRTRNNMNLFKMKENKELATRLDTVEYPKLSSLRESSKKAREDYLKSIDKEIDALKNENIKERKREIKNLEARKNEIINELTKNR